MALALLALICAAKAAAGEVEQVAGGSANTCVRGSNGHVKCWGNNDYGQLGLGTKDNMGDGSNEMGDHLPPVALGTGRSAVDLAAGSHTCARLDDGSVKCWGYNNYGQLGLGTTDNMGDGSNELGDYLPPVALGAGRSAVEVAAHVFHTCARLDDGSVKCWGWNYYGQLGLGTTDNMGDGSNEMGDYLPPVALGAGRSAVEVAVGLNHACARLDDGSVKCWGYNHAGQLGLGTTENMGDGSNEMGDYLPPVALGAGRSAVEVAAGGSHTCARLDDGSVKCWGTNNYGQLGLGTMDTMGDGSNELGDYLPPVALGAGRSAVEVAAGGSHTCARLDDGSVKCWGWNYYGQLGLGTTDNMGDGSNEMGDYLPPVALGTGRSAVEVAVAENHACARLDDGSVKCWGHNSNGRLGLGTTDNMGDGSNEMGDHLPPVDIIMPTTTTTTTTSKTSTSSTTGTSSTSTTGSTTTSSSTDSTTSTSTTSTSTTSTSTSGSTSRTSSTSTTGTISTTTSSHTSTSTLTSTKSTLTITSSSSTTRSSSSTTTTSTSTSASSVSQTSRTTTTRSVITSTAATAEEREEQQRKEDAQAAVDKVESATQDALARLLGSLNGTDNASTGVLGEVSISSDAGEGKVVVLAAFGEPATVSVDKSEATAEVPADVLQQAQDLAGDGLLMLSVVVMSEEMSEKFSTPPAATQEGERRSPPKLLSTPLVVNIRDENGTIIDIGPLKTPMTVQLEVKKEEERRLDQASKIARRRCAYWDEERAVWETNPKEIVSIEDDESKPGLVQCETKRMAIFGIVLEEFENTLKCGTLGQLLNADALANISRTDWLLQMPTLVVMCFLLMSGLVLGYAKCKDSQAEGELSREKRETMLDQGADESTAVQTRCGRLAGMAEDSFGAMASVIEPERFINKCVREVLAYRTGLDSQSIRLIIPRDQIEDSGEEEPMRAVRSRARLCTCPRRIQLRYRLSHLHTRMSHRLDLHQLLDINRTGKATVAMMLHGSLLRRVIILFPAVHAYSVLFRLYAITPAAVRVSAIILKMLSAGFTNAIFFTTTAQQAVEGCNTEELSLERSLIRKFWVGLLSAVLGDVILFVLLLIQKPSSKPNEEAKDKTIRLRRKRMLYWVASSCYGATCVCYIMLFLANVQPKDAEDWLQATGISLLKDAILKPTLMALALGSFTSLALCCRPGLKESIQRHWLRGGETEEEARPVPLARGSSLPRPSTQQNPRRGMMDTE